MAEQEKMKIIARVHTDFPTKFGVPRQSRLVEGLKGRIVFEPEFRNPDALEGLEGYSHIWVIWEFSENVRTEWSATVRPPRLGRNRHMGVFASRSPFRPNPIGLSCLRLLSIEQDEKLGPVLQVEGIDMMDGTPVFDIKPYNPYSDSVPDAEIAFAKISYAKKLTVHFPEELRKKLPEEKAAALEGVLREDPRPSYASRDPERIYGMEYAGFDVRFRVTGGELTVCGAEPLKN
ncbi:MAG: tRNA (N6-threonylcarbamoyladenosine(37)-N6)-methyltransferase TrmO [Lachnospiraceae bacterium]|jgi:tRNA-Thr(GGU) m(6)t(6)A37 methyltransferase TsaA|nr:tRNA (N6-threonylcarbamoyladenosine(37)-N6)-methyltransferase TrmO [Lachnospiraceae bacterium]MCI1726515.1 tRNA (N6-threonylcarbamoyladenosine(37)-N6)-methyltransferase TrmO [Lachnospiraceae bacterium]